MPKISLPSVTSPLPPDMRAFVQRVREAFSAIGSAAITRDELEGANLISVTSSGQVVPGSAIGEGEVVIDYTPPPAPTNLSAYGAVTTIILEWDEPLYSNHAFTEVWRSTSDNLGTAVKVGSTDSFLYADPLGDSGITYYYWVRFVSSADVVGPYNGVAGTLAETGKAGPNNIAELAVGTAHLANLSVVEGKIADLAVTNAKFGGYLQSNNYVPGTSGWHINKDGTIEISSATVRNGVWAGSISSTAGVTVGVGGNIKGGATAFGTGTGFWMGYDSGAYKFRIGTPGSSRAEWNGSAFNIYDSSGNLTISSGVVDYSKVSGAPTSLSNINPSEGSKLSGIAAGATVGATWGSNISGQPTDSQIFNAGKNLCPNPDLEGNLGDTVNAPGWTQSYIGVPLYRLRYVTDDSIGPPWNKKQPVFYANCDSADDVVRWQSDLIDVNESTDYCLSCWARKYSGTPTVYLRLIAYAADGVTILGYPHALAGFTGLTSNWEQYYGVIGPSGIAFPAGTRKVRVEWYGAYLQVAASFATRFCLNEGKVPNKALLPPNLVGQHNPVTPANISTYIANAAIGNAQIGGDIYSSNWNYAGGSGWLLDRGGNFYGNNIYARGDIQASSLQAGVAMVGTANIWDANITRLKVAGEQITVPRAAYTGGGILISGGWTTIQTTPWMDAGGGSVVVIGKGILTGDSGQIRILAPSGAVLDETPSIAIPRDGAGSMGSMPFICTGVSNQSGVYTLQAAGYYATGRMIVAIGCAR